MPGEQALRDQRAPAPVFRWGFPHRRSRRTQDAHGVRRVEERGALEDRADLLGAGGEQEAGHRLYVAIDGGAEAGHPPAGIDSQADAVAGPSG